MFISSVFKAVSRMFSQYEESMNTFYRELGKMDKKTQMRVLGSMHHYRR